MNVSVNFGLLSGKSFICAGKGFDFQRQIFTPGKYSKNMLTWDNNSSLKTEKDETLVLSSGMAVFLMKFPQAN